MMRESSRWITSTTPLAGRSLGPCCNPDELLENVGGWLERKRVGDTLKLAAPIAQLNPTGLLLIL